MNQLIKLSSSFKGTYPKLGKALVVASGFSLVMSAYSYYFSFQAEKEVEWRKNQLSLPIYRLSEEQHISPPWNKQNIQQWLYRRVQVTGRIIHRNACLVPHFQNGTDGFQYIVPLLVKEQQNRANPQGLIVSKGFIPYSVKDPGTRYRIQNTSKRSFVGFVSQLPELQNQSFLEGNCSNQHKLKFTCSDLDDFVQASGFVNQKQASVALVEELRQTGSLNERNHLRRQLDCTGTQNYPYAKTQSGALQLKKMPWTYRKQANYYFVSSLISMVIGASII